MANERIPNAREAILIEETLNSSLVLTVGFLHERRPTKPAFHDSALGLPPHLERERALYDLRLLAEKGIIAQDPEFQQLVQLADDKEKSRFRNNPKTMQERKNALVSYLNLLTGEAPLDAKILAASPAFQKNIKIAIEGGGLGPYFVRSLEKLAQGNKQNTTFIFSNLELFRFLDHYYFWLKDRAYINPEDQTSMAARADAPDVQASLAHKDHALKAIPKLTAAADELLGTVFNTEDSSPWRRFLLENPTSLYLLTFFSDPEDFDPQSRISRLKSLVNASEEQHWSTIYSYFEKTLYLSPVQQKKLDSEIDEGNLQRVKAFVKFHEITAQPTGQYMVYYGEEHTIEKAWIDKFIDGEIDENQFLKIARGIRLRRTALEFFPEPFRRYLAGKISLILNNPEIYDDPEFTAEVIKAGVVPNKQTRDRFRNSPERLKPSQEFAAKIAAAYTDFFSSDLTPLVEHWIDEFTLGNIEEGKLKNVAVNVTSIAHIIESLPKSTPEERDEREYLKILLEGLLQFSDLSQEADFQNMFSIQTLQEFKRMAVVPTITLLQYALQTPTWQTEFQRLQLETALGHFDPENQIQKELEFGYFLKVNKLTVDKITHNAYEAFGKLEFKSQISPPTKDVLSAELAAETRYTAIEAARVFLLIKEEVDRGKNVLVVGNNRYGKLFVVDIIQDELERIGVRITDTYARSGQRNTPNGELFSQGSKDLIEKERPDIFVVDGTSTPLTNGIPRYSSAMSAFIEYFQNTNYQTRFWSTHEGNEVFVGNAQFPNNTTQKTDNPTLTIVNSTINPGNNPRFNQLQEHIAGYFDDFEKYQRNKSDILFTSNGLVKMDLSHWSSQERLLSNLQRELKLSLPYAIMSPLSDPNLRI